MGNQLATIPMNVATQSEKKSSPINVGLVQLIWPHLVFVQSPNNYQSLMWSKCQWIAQITHSSHVIRLWFQTSTIFHSLIYRVVSMSYYSNDTFLKWNLQDLAFKPIKCMFCPCTRPTGYWYCKCITRKLQPSFLKPLFNIHYTTSVSSSSAKWYDTQHNHKFITAPTL